MKKTIIVIGCIVLGILLFSGCISIGEWANENESYEGKLSKVWVADGSSGRKYLVLNFENPYNEVGFHLWSLDNFLDCRELVNHSVNVSYIVHYLSMPGEEGRRYVEYYFGEIKEV